ncbi:MAG TPA: hypothetical protein VKR06_25100 [Ktedonosporobacter sp.]|nr:hypothetical protein [Ktedonosporobacter sp.]
MIRFPFGTRTYQINDEFEHVPSLLLSDGVAVHITALQQGPASNIRIAIIALVDEERAAEIRAYRREALENGVAVQACDITHLYWTPFALVEDPRGLEALENNFYRVVVRRMRTSTGWPELVHLSIQRRDKSSSMPWRDLQRIKNELVGPESQGHEFYPPESSLVDAANQRHLFVFNCEDPILPWQFADRLVGNGATIDVHVAQDDLPEELRPADWLVGEALEQRLRQLDPEQRRTEKDLPQF